MRMLGFRVVRNGHEERGDRRLQFGIGSIFSVWRKEEFFPVRLALVPSAPPFAVMEEQMPVSIFRQPAVTRLVDQACQILCGMLLGERCVMEG